VDENVFAGFCKWLDKILEDNNSDDVAAFWFCLMDFDEMVEDEDTIPKIGEYHILLSGSDEFDLDVDSEWARSNIFSSDENNFTIDSFIVDAKIAGQKWSNGLDFCIRLVIKYLEEGKNKSKLLKKEAVAIGFTVDELYILYNNGVINKNIKIK
jgi:hypothetical protein